MRALKLLTYLIAFTFFISGCVRNECDYKKIINAPAGEFCGVDDNITAAYLGIRYANGSKTYRWQKAGAVVREDSAKLLSSFGPRCIQGDDYSFPFMSEDCLYLNIWTPAHASGDNKKPVLVFIHGGSFVEGEASYSMFNGNNLAREHDIIVVTFNYRLGVFGTFNVPDSYKDDANVSITTGNFGYLDQQLALKWVHDNIEYFGGDSSNVTLMGESAGAMSVAYHLADGNSSQYFNAAILQSPYMGFFEKNASLAASMGSDIATALQNRCASGSENCIYDLSSDTVQQVANTISSTLTEAYIAPSNGKLFASLFPYAPYIDNEYIQTYSIYSDAQKPLLIGTVENESNYMLYLLPYLSELSSTMGWTEFVNTYFSPEATAILSSSRYGTSNQDRLANVVNDFIFRSSAYYYLRHNNANALMYMYRYNAAPFFNVFGSDVGVCEPPVVCHASELPFVFNRFYDFYNQAYTSPDQNDNDFSLELGGLWSSMVKNNRLSSVYEANTLSNNSVVYIDKTVPYFSNTTFEQLVYYQNIWEDILNSYKP